MASVSILPPNSLRFVVNKTQEGALLTMKNICEAAKAHTFAHTRSKRIEQSWRVDKHVRLLAEDTLLPFVMRIFQTSLGLQIGDALSRILWPWCLTCMSFWQNLALSHIQTSKSCIFDVACYDSHPGLFGSRGSYFKLITCQLSLAHGPCSSTCFMTSSAVTSSVLWSIWRSSPNLST